MFEKHSYSDILENNKIWVNNILKEKPDYFIELSKGQSPGFLYIGCCDSRLPLSIYTQTSPGEIFVHRNIANQVINNDLNFNSVLQYAVNNLKIDNIIIAGHYDCGGVKAAFYNNANGYVRKWIKQIRKVYINNKSSFINLSDKECCDKLSELNVIKQIDNILKNNIIKKAIDSGRKIKIFGWIIDIYSGLIKEVKLVELNK